MNIKAKLRINSLAPVVLVVIIAAILVITWRYVSDISERGKIANNIVKDVFELTLITDEYLLNSSARTIRQWQLKYDSLGESMSAIMLTSRDDQIIFERVKQEYRGIKTTFNELISNHEKQDALQQLIKGNPGKETADNSQNSQQGMQKDLAILKQFENRLSGQILPKSQAMVSGALQLANSGQLQVAAMQTWAAVIIMSCVLLLGLLISLISQLINRSIVRPLATITNATKVIADGDLSHRIAMRRRDEIGYLSKTFDQMMDTLESTTASRDELNKANEDLRNSTAQLIQAEKMASIGQMVAGVAHEINTPLAYVRSSVEIAKDQIPEITTLVAEYGKLRDLLVSSQDDNAIAKQFEVVTQLENDFKKNEVMEESSTLMSRSLHGLDQIRELVMNMKNFSRMDRDRVTEYSINEGIDSVIMLATPVLKNHVQIEKHYTDIPHISCSPSQINQVLLNVITNAAQAIEGNDGCIWIETALDNDQVKVTVRDNGKGIEPAVITKIFDPFFTTKEVGDGTGLGLSIAHTIMEEHGGEIRMDSTVGKGSTVTISLPAQSHVDSRMSA